MKVLITGGCGFLGTNLASHFIKNNEKVYIIDSLERDGAKKNLNWLKSLDLKNQLIFLKSDIKENRIINSFFEKYAPFDFICHVAGQVAMTTSISNPRKDLETNIIGTFNILEAVRTYSPESFLAFSSTNKVYGDLQSYETLEKETRYVLKNYPKGLDENTPLDFSTPYGCSKGSAEQYVRDWSRVYNLKTVVFRHSSIYGGRQYASVNQGWIGWFCKKALGQSIYNERNLRIDPFTISGNGKQVRDVLHSEDLVSLYCLAYEKREIASGEIFNIGGGFLNSLSILELFEILKEELSIKELKFKIIERRTSDQDCFIANIEKAENVLSWKPKISSLEGIKKMLNWSRNLI